MTSYIVLGIAILILALVFGQFRPSSTKQITDNLYAVNTGFVNFYAATTADGVVLFDTGINTFLAKRGLRKLGLAPSDVTQIFFTHTDYDHTGGLGAFQYATRHISTEEEQMVNGETARRGFLRNRSIAPYRALKDGETVKIGDVSVQMRLAPGHTPGSATYLIDDHILITGDLLRLTRNGDVRPFLRLMNMDHGQDVQTIEDMQDAIQHAEYILTGHTGTRRRKKA